MIPNIPLTGLVKREDLTPGTVTSPCVYFVFSNDELLYVGATIQLLTRLRAHHRREQFAAAENVSIGWIEVEDADLRAIERQYIETLTPTLNGTHPPNKDYGYKQVYVDEETHKKLQELAASEGRTLGEQVRRLVDEELKRRATFQPWQEKQEAD